MAIRIGVVGLGQVARARHLPAIAGDPAFRLAGLASLGGGPGVAGLEVHGDHHAMLASCALDAVAICTPPAARFAIARDVLRAGKHVLLEKPPAATMGEAEALVALAAREGRVLFATWHSQCNEAVEAARRFLAGRRVAALRIDWSEDFRRFHPDQDWIWQADGLGVFDMGINALSVVSRLFADPPFVRSAELHVAANHAAPISAVLRLGSPDGDAPMEVRMDWSHRGEHQRELRIETTCGHRLELLDSGGRLVVDGAVVVDRPRAEYAFLYARFAALLREGRGEADLAPLRMTLDALATGRRTRLPPFADEPLQETTR
jgi:D-galactose 1-dehydrogenase